MRNPFILKCVLPAGSFLCKSKLFSHDKLCMKASLHKEAKEKLIYLQVNIKSVTPLVIFEQNLLTFLDIPQTLTTNLLLKLRTCQHIFTRDIILLYFCK